METRIVMRGRFAGLLAVALGSLLPAWTAHAAEGCVTATTGTVTSAAQRRADSAVRQGDDAGGATIMQTSLAGVPAIVRVPPKVTKSLIVLWHGLGPPESESELMSALPLDDVPAVKVYLGLPLFGARAPATGAETLAQRQTEDYALRIFEPIVVGAARELPRVLAALRERKCPGANGKIGLFGFSAGGAAVLVALTDPNIPVSAAVTINAPTGLASAVGALEHATKRPYAWSAAARQLAQQTDPISHARAIAGRQPPPAILLVHGADDTVISSTDSALLEKSLSPLYTAPGHADRLSLVVAPGVTHSWAQSPNAGAVRRYVADWFNRFL
jgi:dienelactone hydrolase